MTEEQLEEWTRVENQLKDIMMNKFNRRMSSCDIYMNTNQISFFMKSLGGVKTHYKISIDILTKNGNIFVNGNRK